MQRKLISDPIISDPFNIPQYVHRPGIELHPSLAIWSKGKLAQKLFNEGVKNLEQEKWSDAVGKFKTAKSKLESTVKGKDEFQASEKILYQTILIHLAVAQCSNHLYKECLNTTESFLNTLSSNDPLNNKYSSQLTILYRHLAKSINYKTLRTKPKAFKFINQYRTKSKTKKQKSNNQPLNKAQKLFDEGMKNIGQKKWSVAVGKFKNSKTKLDRNPDRTKSRTIQPLEKQIYKTILIHYAIAQFNNRSKNAAFSTFNSYLLLDTDDVLKIKFKDEINNLAKDLARLEYSFDFLKAHNAAHDFIKPFIPSKSAQVLLQQKTQPKRTQPLSQRRKQTRKKNKREVRKSLLHKCAKNEDCFAAEALLENYADVNVKNSLGQTPLHVAAQEGKIQFIQLLLSKEANRNAKDNEGRTPLMLAVEAGKMNLVNSLVKELNDLYIMDKKGNTVAFYAKNHTNKYILKQLISKFCKQTNEKKCTKKEKEEKRNLTEKLMPTRQPPQNPNALNKLYQVNTSVNYKGENGRTILHSACDMGLFNLCERRLNLGENINATDDFGMTPLILAIVGGHMKIVKLLIERAIDLETTDNDGLNYLNSVPEDDEEIAFTNLFKEGMDKKLEVKRRLESLKKFCAVFPDYKGEGGSTPLMHAALNGNIEFVKLLHNDLKDLQIRDLKNKTVLTYALNSKNIDAIRYLADESIIHLSDEAKKEVNAIYNSFIGAQILEQKLKRIAKSLKN